jgi:hypothetical protein
MPKKLLAPLLLFLAMATVGATIYKWVDEKGVTHYSATPPPNQKAREIQTQPSPPAAGTEGSQPTPKTWQEKEQGFQKRRAEREEAQKREEEEEAKAKREAFARKQGCILARQNLHTLQMQKAVYSINEKGERVFLDDEMRAAEIERMKKEVESYCEPQ